MSRSTFRGASGTIQQRLRADVQKPQWINKKMLESNRFMFWSNHACDLSANSTSYVGHDFKSGTNWTPIQWFDVPLNLSSVPVTLAQYQLVAQKQWPLQSPYSAVRGSNALSDSIVGPDYYFPGNDWMRKAKLAIAGNQGFSDNSANQDKGTWTRVTFAHHRFHFSNYSRHPVELVAIYQAHGLTGDVGGIIDTMDDSLTAPGPDLKRIPNATILRVPGAFDNEGTKPGRSFFDVDFSPKEFDKERYEKVPMGGTVDDGGLWRKLNVKYDTAFIDKIDANGVWENTTSPWEHLSPDSKGLESEAGVVFYARFNLPMANVSMPAYSPKVESDPNELTDAYKLLNIRVESRFLNEIRRSETMGGYTGKDYRAVPTAV